MWNSHFLLPLLLPLLLPFLPTIHLLLLHLRWSLLRRWARGLRNRTRRYGLLRRWPHLGPRPHFLSTLHRRWSGRLRCRDTILIPTATPVPRHYTIRTANILPLDEVLPALQQTYGSDMYYRTIIPKAAYNLPQDVPVVAVAVILVVSETMPEALAHDITKTLFDEQPALAAIHPQARALALPAAVKGAAIPFHAGAERFYRERGVWTP